MHDFGMTGGFWLGGLWMILWWVLVLVGIIALVKWTMTSQGRRDRTGSDNSALDILRERYARGEIDEQAFHKRKRDLIQ